MAVKKTTDCPHLAAMARPSDAEELVWLRNQGIQLVVTLTESPIRRDWINDDSPLDFYVPHIRDFISRAFVLM